MKSFAEEMSFYAAYHQERRNVAIHLIGVPLISYSVLIPMSWLKFSQFGLNLSLGGMELTLAMVFTAAILLYYFFLDVVFALAATVLYVGMLALATYTASFGYTVGLSVFAVAFFGGWIAQFYGHYAFEKVRPALFDNLFQALFSAPIFVVADVFFQLGFRREIEEDVRRRLSAAGKLRAVA